MLISSCIALCCCFAERYELKVAHIHGIHGRQQPAVPGTETRQLPNECCHLPLPPSAICHVTHGQLLPHFIRNLFITCYITHISFYYYKAAQDYCLRCRAMHTPTVSHSQQLQRPVARQVNEWPLLYHLHAVHPFDVAAGFARTLARSIRGDVDSLLCSE